LEAADGHVVGAVEFDGEAVWRWALVANLFH
jgi:hypothetical protein